MRRWLLILALLAGPAHAVQPDEMLDDPALEAQARRISAGLRCPVCQNESIDESNAPISRDLRILLREMLVAGRTEDEIIDFIVARYGEIVLLNPPAAGGNLILWLAGPAMLLGAGAIGWSAIRRRQSQPHEAGLSAEEEARLAEILRDK